MKTTKSYVIGCRESIQLRIQEHTELNHHQTRWKRQHQERKGDRKMKRITRDIVDNMTQDEIKETLRDMRKQCHTCAQHAQMVDSPEYQLLIGKIDWTLFAGLKN